MRGTVLAGVAVALALSSCGAIATRPATQDAGEHHTAAAAGPAVRWPDQARYTLDLAYDPAKHAISGTERIAFRNVGPQPLRSVWLRVWANAFGGCRVSRAHVTIRGGGRFGARQRSCTALEVRLARPLAPNAETEIALQIRVAAPRAPDRFGQFHGASYFGNALPILAVADKTGVRLPPYTFAGESFYSLTSAWRVRLRVPADLQVASTGTQQGGRDASGAVTLVAPRARDFMLVVGRFSVRTSRVGGIRLRRFSIPGTSAAAARRTLRTAALAMRSYERWYGPYGRPEVDLVEGPGEVARGGVAMEYPEIVLTPEQPTAVAHELAHQWFYSIVGDDQYDEPWLDESFAEFSAARLPPRRVPNRLRDCALPDASRVPLDGTMATMTRGAGGRYVRTVYVGGACFLRAVRRELGAARFDAFMQRLVATHRDGVETTAEFVAALRAAAPGNRTIERLLTRTGLAS
jgi:hypothetical protein